MNIINGNLYSPLGINFIFLACVFMIVSRWWNVDSVLTEEKKERREKRGKKKPNSLDRLIHLAAQQKLIIPHPPL